MNYLSHLSLALICMMSLNGCISTSAIEQSQRPTQWATSVNPQNNLYKITATLYRSDQPFKADAQQLNDLNIKTIVNLRTRNQDAVEFINSNTQLIHIPIQTWAITDQNIADALWHIKQGQDKGGVLVHCYHGSDRTGLTIAMYRIIYQNWPIEDAKQEMKHGGYGFHPIWQNISAFFQPERVEKIKSLIKQKELNQPS